eukprot:g3257.t1
MTPVDKKRFRCNNVYDIIRGALVYSNMKGIWLALHFIITCKEFKILRVKDRFTPGRETSGGWRDCIINGYLVSDSQRHVLEVQLHHESLLLIREDLGGHYIYAIYRALNEALEVHSIDRSRVGAKLGANGDESKSLFKIVSTVKKSSDDLSAVPNASTSWIGSLIAIEEPQFLTKEELFLKGSDVCLGFEVRGIQAVGKTSAYQLMCEDTYLATNERYGGKTLYCGMRNRFFFYWSDLYHNWVCTLSRANFGRGSGYLRTEKKGQRYPSGRLQLHNSSKWVFSGATITAYLSADDVANLCMKHEESIVEDKRSNLAVEISGIVGNASQNKCNGRFYASKESWVDAGRRYALYIKETGTHFLYYSNKYRNYVITHGADMMEKGTGFVRTKNHNLHMPMGELEYYDYGAKAWTLVPEGKVSTIPAVEAEKVIAKRAALMSDVKKIVTVQVHGFSPLYDGRYAQDADLTLGGRPTYVKDKDNGATCVRVYETSKIKMKKSTAVVRQTTGDSSDFIPKVNDVVMVSWGQNNKKYRAKIIDVKQNPSAEKPFKVHYCRWNAKWDEWIPRSKMFRMKDVTLSKKRARLNMGHIGRRVKKEFDEGPFLGTVIGKDEENGHWKIHYDDDDTEEVSDDELMDILLNESDAATKESRTPCMSEYEGWHIREAKKTAPKKYTAGYPTEQWTGRKKKQTPRIRKRPLVVPTCSTDTKRSRARAKKKGTARQNNTKKRGRSRAKKTLVARKIKRRVRQEDISVRDDVPDRVWVKWKSEPKTWYDCRVLKLKTDTYVVQSYEHADPSFEGVWEFLPFGFDKRSRRSNKKPDHVWCRMDGAMSPRDVETASHCPIRKEASQHLAWLSEIALDRILKEASASSTEATRAVFRRVCYQIMRRWYGYGLDIENLTWSQLLSMHRNARAPPIPTRTSVENEIARKTRTFTLRTTDDALKASMTISKRQDLLVVGEGFERLVRWLRKKLPASAVTLQRAVTCINSSGRASYVRIRCSDGSTLTARQVVVTLPIGVMRHSAEAQRRRRSSTPENGVVRFVPPLSKRRCDALLQTPIAYHEKTALCYTRTFWGRRALRKGEIGFNTRSEEDGGRRFIASTDRRWGSITNMDAFNRSESGAVVLGHVFPPQSTDSIADCDPDAFDAHLKSIFNGADSDVQRTDQVTTSWAEDPYARCSYTEYAALDVKESTRLVMDLAEPKQKRVHFAGEHAVADNGNVAGAYTSGLLRADDVLACFDDAKRKKTKKKSQTDVDILIVGAGIAGLTAAAEIHMRRPDLRLRVLEARDRLGGRVHTKSMRCADGSTQKVELGASYIHGFKFDPKA